VKREREILYLEAEAGVQLVNSGGLLVGEAADDKDDHCAHSALVVPTKGGELKHNENFYIFAQVVLTNSQAWTN
jgi:hypothetical protein